MAKDTEQSFVDAWTDAAKEVARKEAEDLLDFFAAAAMQGILAAGSDADGSAIAEDAYDVADAMVAERAKRRGRK